MEIEKEILVYCHRAIAEAVEILGIKTEKIIKADNLPGYCLSSIYRVYPHQGDVNISFRFLKAFGIEPQVEFRVAAFAENFNHQPYLCQHCEIESGMFPYNRIPKRWLVRVIQKAVSKLQVLCRSENFDRLEKEHNLRMYFSRFITNRFAKR